MKRLIYYEITLEQQWEHIFACENFYKEGNTVTVDVEVECEVVTVVGIKAMHDLTNVVDGATWFKGLNKVIGQIIVGLIIEIMERMKQEQERVCWVFRSEKHVRLKRIEEFDSNGSKWE